MRRALDALYDGCQWLAAVCLFMIFATILAQVVGSAAGIYIRGTDAYAGYLMAGASFFALAHTLTRGEHIRVTLVLDRFRGGARRALEVWCHVAAIVLAAAFAWFAWDMVRWSWAYTDISAAEDRTPLWIPQLSMAIGTTVLTVAFVDGLVGVLTGRVVARAGDEPAHVE
jgi:TRAP-type C4-dicarboxylate transport system permease small subunit